MSTVTEIVEAVKHLSMEQKRNLLLQLEPVLIEPLAHGEMAGPGDSLSPDFTTRLVEHFHRAKRAALGQF